MGRLPIRGEYVGDWKEIAERVKAFAEWRCIRCKHPNKFPGHVLTVHHWDGDKGNNRWWNLMALCQVCHLQIQGKVDPERPFFLEHTDWCKPYAAGFYASKYLELDLDREETMERLEELLQLEGGVA